MAKLAVVTVSYYSGDVLVRFLDTLERATTEPPEVVVADNGTDDASLDQVRDRPGIRILSTGENIGYGAAANVGVMATDAEFVLVTNPDIEWQPGCIDALLEAAGRWPNAGSLGPLVHTPAGKLYPSARALPSIGRGIGHALFGWCWPANPWTAAYRRERGTPVEGPSGWLSGCCLLLRRSAFDGIKGFDPGYFMYFEDVDLGDRLGRAGWQNVYVPTAAVVHAGGHATMRDRDRMITEHHRSAARYLARRYAGWSHAPLRVLIRCGLAFRAAIARRFRQVAKGAEPQRSATD